MSRAIPQIDLRAVFREHDDEIAAATKRVLQSGWYILGEEVAAMEREFAAYIGVPHGVGVASGTDAVEVALRACGVGSGDVVYTVAHTAVGTVVGIERAGAAVEWVDVDPATCTMCPNALESAIRNTDPKTAGKPTAIVPVHLYGRPVDLPAILDVAQRHGLLVIEDCAQAHGAAIGGRRVGTWGTAAAFSFYPTKNLGALGDGGMVVTSDSDVAQRAGEIREYGWQDRYVSSFRGVNSRLDELQAAILRARLPHLDEQNDRRRHAAQRYSDALAESGVELPPVFGPSHHVYHQYVVQSDDRDGLRQRLNDEGIGTAIHYPVPIHRQPAYAELPASRRPLPATENAARRVLSLPMHPCLNDVDVDRIAATIRAWSRGD